MKSLNNIIENFFSNVGAKPMTLREFIINLLDSETNTLIVDVESSDNNFRDASLIRIFLDWMLDDDFDNSRKIKGMNIRKFLLNNMDKPVIINADIVDENSPRIPKAPYLRGRYVYNLTVDGEKFTWFRYKLYPWISNKPKKI